jgi:DNA-binding MarR family transcriptional regulator
MDFKCDYLFYSILARFSRLYAKALTKRLAPYGVLPGYLDVFFHLWEQDGISQKALHTEMDVEQATLSNTLKRMERDGFVLRRKNPKDRRQSQIILTDSGAGLRKIVLTALDDLQSVVNTRLSVNDIRYFRRILTQMNEQLLSDLDDATLVLLDEVDQTDDFPIMLVEQVEN